MRRALPWLLLALLLAVLLCLPPSPDASHKNISHRSIETPAPKKPASLSGEPPSPIPENIPRSDPPGATPSAASVAFARWIATSPADALEWLSQQNEGPLHDPAALQISTYFLARSDFTQAQIWADLIRDPALSLQARTAVLAERYRAQQIDVDGLLRSGLPPQTLIAILDGSLLD